MLPEWVTKAEFESLKEKINAAFNKVHAALPGGVCGEVSHATWLYEKPIIGGKQTASCPWCGNKLEGLLPRH